MKLSKILSFKRNKKNFVITHILAVFIFSLLYYILDKYISDPIIKETKHLTEKKKKEEGTYIYWLWFSVITQTTVGYNFYNHNNEIFYNDFSFKYDLLKVINIIQCFSIFFLSSLFI